MAHRLSRALLRCTARRTPLALAARPTPLPLSSPRPPSLPAHRSLHASACTRATTTSQTVYTTGSACPQCGAPLPKTLAPLCPSCSQLLPPPPPSSTYFDLFGLDPTYAIDVKALKRTFLQLQQKVHPDMFSGKGDVENWAKAWSGRVNDAYKALSNDRERGEYLLSLHDVTIGEGDPVTDPELLMNIMETREALEEASTEEEVAEIRRRNADASKEAIAALGSALSISPPDLETARNLVIELKYFENIDVVCREWQPGQRIELQH
ncbi:hypothetical protein JCM10207_008413 [Rhodosporidiobolus poonsookiae]